jgi:hypothetical protein
MRTIFPPLFSPLSRKGTAQAEFREALPVGDGAAVGADVDFILQVDGQVFRELFFYNGFVFIEDLMVEVQCVLEGRVFIEIPADGNEHARLARGHRQSGIQDV